VERLRARFVRAELDDTAASLNKKLRTASVRKIPNLLVVGARERQAQTVTLRRYGVREQRTLPAPEFIDAIVLEIADRAAQATAT
jgi:threonyl-tRNA synthetase